MDKVKIKSYYGYISITDNIGRMRNIDYKDISILKIFMYDISRLFKNWGFDELCGFIVKRKVRNG